MSLAYSEKILDFRCQEENLLGIVSTPNAETPAIDLGVIIVVGGPLYRVGSHRQFVLLARSLAESGIITMRFDYRGMGDSSGSMRDFLAITPDIKASIDAMLGSQPSLRRIVLWGLCDGASASLIYCDDTHDARVHGLAVLNPWVRSAESLARTQVKHYYLQRLRQPEFWRKLISGKVAASAISGLWMKIRQATQSAPGDPAHQLAFPNRMARAWATDNKKTLLVLSGQDYTAKEFLEVCYSCDRWKQLLNNCFTQRYDLLNADHTFSDPASTDLVASMTVNWLTSSSNFPIGG